MSIELIERLSTELTGVSLIRLNYSGESVNHPRFDEALRHAKAMGARTELVSALASIPATHLRALVDCGLDRLSVSLHTLDARQFDQIYRFSSLNVLREKLSELGEYKNKQRSRKPEVDFAFVAMQRNLDQLQPVASYAEQLRVKRISVHPVIQRDPADIDVSWELTGPQELRPAFARALGDAVADATSSSPGVAIEISRPLAETRVGGNPGGRFTCEQNPFETAHILADGSVVPCEVLDGRVMGNLTQQSVDEIWGGAVYRAFREDYSSGRIAACNRCEFRKRIEAAGPVMPLYGWYDRDDRGTLWSHRVAEASVEEPNSGVLRLRGILPPAASGENRLDVSSGGRVIGSVANRGQGNLAFELSVEPSGPLTFTTQHIYCAADRGEGSDIRELGFALTGADWSPVENLKPPGHRSDYKDWWIERFLYFLDKSDSGSRRQPPFAPEAEESDGVGVIIPARGSTASLIECLESLNRARTLIAEPLHVIVIASGSNLSPYHSLQRSFPWIQFLYRERPAGFSKAVQEGLRHIRSSWVYLLNSDMTLDEEAIARLLPHRAADVFGIGSHISPADQSHSETGLTALRISFGRAEISDLDPGRDCSVREHVYCGGGSSLFRTSLLRRFGRETHCYDPFYWEDVEWGYTARHFGFRNLFLPKSHVRHQRRATIRQFYKPSEVNRVFERNRLLFEVRCLPSEISSGALRYALRCADPVTVREILRPKTLLSSIRQRRKMLSSDCRN